MGFFASSGILNRRGFFSAPVSAVPPAFSPTDISGLKLWLKADAGVTMDGANNVTSWADQSGNNISFNGSAYILNNEINSKPAIYFDGDDSQNYLTCQDQGLLNGLTGLSFFFTWKVYNNDSNKGLFGSSNYDAVEIVSNPLAQIRIRNQNYDASFLYENDWFDIDNNYSISSFVAENGDGNAYKNASIVDGTFGENIELPIADDVTFELGRYAYPNYDLYAKVKIAEFIIYGKKLNLTELGQVHNYLNERYAIY